MSDIKKTGGRLGRKHTPETKAKMSLTRKGRILSEETKKKIAAAHLGKKRGPLSGARRQQISILLRQAYAEGRRFPAKWSGGRFSERGYILVLAKNHPGCNNKGYVREHRLTVEKIMGRYLRPLEYVHHKNKKRDDNRPENLMVFKNRAAHVSFEAGHTVSREDIVFDGASMG